MSNRTVAATALAALAALALAACGSSETPGSSTSVSSSASAAAGARSGDTVDGAALASRVIDAMVKAGSGTMTMELGSEGRATGSFVMKGDTMEQQLTMPIGGQQMELISTGGVLYMKGLPGSEKPWVKIDPKGDDPFSKMFASVTDQIGDPRELAKALEGTSAKVVSSTGGVTEYVVSIDPSTMLGDSQLGPAAPSMEPVEAHYFIDAQDRPTKIEVQVQGQVVLVTFGDWGKQISISAPPADQVGTFEIPTT